MVNYRLHPAPLTLYELSFIELAKHIWTQPNIKSTLIKSFQMAYPHYRGQLYDESFCDHLDIMDGTKKISVLIKTYINTLHLPVPMKEELYNTTVSMRTILVDWLEVIKTENPSIDVQDYYDHVHWAANGSVNTAESIKSLYFSGKLLPNSRATFFMISNHCLQSCIEDFVSKIESLTFGRCFLDGIHNSSDIYKIAIPAYWWFKYTQRCGCDPIEYIRSYLEDGQFIGHTKTELLFLSAVRDHNFTATKYFWNLLDSKSKTHMIHVLNKHSVSHGILKNSRKTMDLIIFLWQQFCTYDVCDFLVDIMSSRCVRTRLANWPWQRIFVQTLNNAVDKVTNYETMIQGLINFIELEIPLSIHSKCREWICHLWSRCPVHLKKSFHFHFIFDAFSMYGYPEIFNCIINDKSWEIIDRKRIFEKLASYWVSCLRDDMYVESIQDCYAELVCSKAEKRWLKKRLNAVSKFDTNIRRRLR